MRPVLTKKELEQMFDADTRTGRLRWKMNSGNGRPGQLAGTVTKNGMMVRISGHLYNMSELVWCIAHGTTPERSPGFADGNTMNWSLGNLKEAMEVADLPNRSGIGALPGLIRKLEAAEARVRTLLERIGDIKAGLVDAVTRVPDFSESATK